MAEGDSQDERYRRAAAEFGAAIDRLARAYEAEPEPRKDLVQEIHLALWRSFPGFDGRCSVRTWVYRVAHNVAASHAIRRKRLRGAGQASLEELAQIADRDDPEAAVGERRALARLMDLIRALEAPDRQVVLLYLEGLDAVGIGEVTGLSPGAIATKVHRLKALLARRFQDGGRRVDRAS
jgi:RNA polymerase sigma-70 factor (ECF subfamily)